MVSRSNSLVANGQRARNHRSTWYTSIGCPHSLERVLINDGESRVMHSIAVTLLVVFARGESSKVKRTVKRIGIAEQVRIGWGNWVHKSSRGLDLTMLGRHYCVAGLSWVGLVENCYSCTIAIVYHNVMYKSTSLVIATTEV